jgi:hypothetical protein
MVTPQTIKERDYTTEVLETAEKFYEWIINNKK